MAMMLVEEKSNNHYKPIRMKKYFKRFFGLLLFLAVIGFLIANRMGYFSSQSSGPELISGRPSTILPVKAVVVKPKPMTDKIIAAGAVLPDEQVEISAEASGRVVAIHFEEGSKVEKGDLLITVNNADLLAQIERNKHQVRLAEEREARQRRLLEKQGISQQAYDQVFTELSTLKAEEAILQAQLDKTIIRAPFSGLLGLRHISEGSYVSPGMKIVKLAKTAPVKIDFTVPERFAGFLKIGGSISFSVSNQPGWYEAKISAIEPVIDQSTRSVIVRAIYENENGHILPGSFARVELILESLENALQIPAQALVPEMGSSKVFLYKNGQATPQMVTTGLRTESHVQIVDGINAGDTVITTGILQMRPGLPVTLNEILPL
jgi:membrane fusion protein, multidrug efflux system